MPNLLRDIVMRPLRGELAESDRRWDHTNASDVSDEGLWRDLADIGRRTPLLVAYEDSYRGWYLAFAAGSAAQVIFLRPEPEFDPDLPLRIPHELVATLAPDLSRAFGEQLRDVEEALEDDDQLFINGRVLRDESAWRRVLATLANVNASPAPITLCTRADAGRRYIWRHQQPTLVSHRPTPVERWTALHALYPHDDAESLFREMVFR
jgi:hypothetical protein